MAILQKIRNRAGIFVIIFVGVALFLFIIDPTTFDTLFRSNPTDIAEINGNDVKYEHYLEIAQEHEEFLKLSQQTNTLDAETSERVQEQAWNDILRENILEIHYDDLGIKVSDEEIEDMLWGRNIHQIIQQNFTNPNTGMIDTAFIKNYFQNADKDETGKQTFIANYLKKAIKTEKLNTKFNTLVAKGLYVPVFLAKDDYYSKNNKVDFVFVTRGFKDIDDATIKTTDADIKAYYDEYIERFKVLEANRDIEFVVFNITASSEDSAAALKDLEKNAAEFATIPTEEVPNFLNRYSDSSYVEKYYKPEEFTLFTGFKPETTKIGDISPVYEFDGAYWQARVLDIAVRPDSVRASHILIRPDSTRSIERARVIGDSLLNVAKKNADFGMLAMQYSDDQGSKSKGGDIDWFAEDAMIVKEFKDACFKGKKGDIVKVETQFGVHIIKITEQTKPSQKFSIGYLTKDIEYSNATAQKKYAEASSFSATNNTAAKFDKACGDLQLTKRIASNVKENDFKINGLENPRVIIKWAYGEDIVKGSVSQVFELADMYIVAKVSAVRNKGNADIEDVRDQIEPIVIRKKKAAKFIEEFNKDISAGMSLDAMAAKYTKPVDTATNISFNTFSIPGFGIEPNVISTATVLEKGKMSKPIEGNNGVYVILVTASVPAPEKTDFSADQLSMIRSATARASYQTYDAMKKAAEIKDYRSTWF